MQLARPKMRGIDVETVLKLVEENAKKRFEVVWGYDPSPPKPAKKKGQNQSKKKVSKGDAAEVDDLRKEMEAAMLNDTAKRDEGDAEWKELPLVVVERPAVDPLDGEEAEDPRGEWFIRASQGHSLKLEGTAHLTPIEDDEEGHERVGLMVHGTRDDLWDVIRTFVPTAFDGYHITIVKLIPTSGETGLSRMDRQHIHLAPAIENHRITPRPSSRLYIYLDLRKVLAAGIKVYTSANGVVLSPGDEDGLIQKEMWKKVERKVRGERTLIWEEGRDAEPPVPVSSA